MTHLMTDSLLGKRTRQRNGKVMDFEDDQLEEDYQIKEEEEEEFIKPTRSKRLRQ